jgi:putative ABC transport system substrate-binding protein
VVALALLIIVWAGGTEAQPVGGRAARLGIVFVGTEEGSRQNLATYRQALQELGYYEGRNLVLEIRYANGRFERAPGLTEELVKLKVDVLIVGGYQLILAATRATATVPIVGVSCGVELFAQSLARPGGNVTGVACMSPDLGTKQLQLAREIVPRAVRVAVLYAPAAPYATSELRDLEIAARALGLTLRPFPLTRPEDLDPAFAQMQREGIQIVLTVSDPLTYSQRTNIAALGRDRSLPTVFSFRDYCDAGGLLCYGSNLQGLIQRATTYVDKILKGARPADLPIEQPVKFDLLINLRTARALGLTISQSVLLRADDVIQ